MFSALFGKKGSKTKVISDIVTDITAKTTESVMNQCSGAIQQTMLSNITTSGSINLSGVNASQAASINMTCAFSTAIKTQITQDVSNKIVQMAEANNALTSLGSSRANAQTNVTNRIWNEVNKINSNTISAISQQMMLSNINAGGDINLTNSTLSQDAKIVVTAYVDAVLNTGIANDVGNYLDQTASASNTGVGAEIGGAFGGLFGGISSTILYVIIFVIFVVFSILIYKFISNRKAKKNNTLTQQPTQVIAPITTVPVENVPAQAV